MTAQAIRDPGKSFKAYARVANSGFLRSGAKTEGVLASKISQMGKFRVPWQPLLWYPLPCNTVYGEKFLI